MRLNIGIIGGMGSLATCEMMHKIISYTEAKTDQEYPRVFVDNNSNISDRTSAILKQGKSPLPDMIESATKLESIGADLLLMPCNTAHYFIDGIQREVKAPILNMLEETVKEVRKRDIKKVGILATDGTLCTGIYTTLFEKEGVEVVLPNDEEQESVMRMIYDGIKGAQKNYNPSEFIGTVERMYTQGAETIVLACTEIPIAWERFHVEGAFIDPVDVIVKHAIVQAGYKLKSE